MRFDLARRRFMSNMAVVNDVSALRQHQCGGEILLDEKDGLTGISEITTGFDKISHDDWR